MNNDQKQRVEQLADEHTEYIQGILEAHDEPEDVQRMILHHYRTAFIHGYKHGVEDSDEQF